MPILQGKVKRIEPDAVWTEIPELAIDQDFPCRWVATNLTVGDFVLVVSLDDAQENIVVVGKLNGEID